MDETAAISQTPTATAPPPEHHLQAFAHGDDDPSFKDVLDTINPLQHIPIINTVYRELTGDKPGSVSRVVGGALFGGPLGMALATIDSIIDDKTGKDVGGHAWASIMGDDPQPDNATMLAKDDTPPASPAEQTAAEPALSEAAAAPAAEPPQTNVAQAEPPPPSPAVAPAPIPVTVAAAPAKDPAPQLLAAKLTSQSMGANASVSAASTAVSPAAPKVDGATPLPQGFLPVPARHSIQVLPPAPPNATLSSNSQHSNIPTAGRAVPSNALTDARDIAVPNPAAVGTEAKPIPNAWLPDAMTKALDKYQKMSKLGQTAQAPSPTDQSSQPTL